jgi:hypothetical protein
MLMLMCCVCAFSLRRESPDMILGDEPLILEVVLSQPHNCRRQATSLTRPTYQYAVGTFNTCSRGLTHRSLTDTGGGYNLGGDDFPHHTPQPSQSVVSALHLRAPPGLQFKPIPPSKL